MHHYGRLKAVCLGAPADGGGWTIWKGNLCDNDAYCMSKCVWTQECIRAPALSVLKQKHKGGMLLIQQAGGRILCAVSVCEIWCMKSTCKSLLEGAFLCAYWSVIVYSNRCWLGEMHPPLCSLQGFNPTLLFTALFSSSNLPSAENVILSLVTFPLFQQMTELVTFGVRLHKWVFLPDLFCYWKINVNFIQQKPHSGFIQSWLLYSLRKWRNH